VDFLTSGCRYDTRRRAGLAPDSSDRLNAAAEAIEIGSAER
jgi:hypothetical protein